MRRVWLAATVLVVASAAATAQTDIKTVVKVVEARYHVRHHGVPMLWIAKPFMIGSGAGGLKMALFEDLRVPAKDTASLQDTVRQALGPGWSPFVETRSNETGESTVIYARPNSHKLKMLIVAVERDEISLIQMHVSGAQRDEWFTRPVKKAHKNKGEPQTADIRGGTTIAAAE